NPLSSRSMPREAPPIFTIGHSTHPIGAFMDLLRQSGIELLVDIRSITGSRRNPQFNAETLPSALAAAGIAYRHLAALGGRRRTPAGAPPSPNGLWRHPAFRSYADYALTPAFRAGLDELVALARERPTAIMC